MRQIKGITAIFLCCLLVAGCDLIDYHPYDVDIKGEKDINAKNIQNKRSRPNAWESLLYALSPWVTRNAGMTKPLTL